MKNTVLTQLDSYQKPLIMPQKISIAKNIFFNGLVQVTSILLNIALLPYITGIFDARLLGINSFGQAIAGYFVLGGNLGITIYGARLIAETRDNLEKNQDSFSKCLTYQFFFNSIALALYCVWCYYQSQPIYYLFSIILLTSMTDLSWAYTGKERFDLIAIRNFIIKIIGTICIFVFIKNKDQLALYIIIQQGVLFLSNIVFWAQLEKINLKVTFCGLRKTLMIIFLPAFSVFLPSIFSSFYMSLNKIMLGYMSTLSEVAVYDYPNRLIRIAATLIAVIGTVLMPRLAYLKQNPNLNEFSRKIKHLLFTSSICSIPIAIILFWLSDPICNIFFHTTLSGASLVLKLIAPTIITSGLSLYIIYVSIDRMKNLTVCIAVGGIFNAIINLWLIKYYAAFGAAMATLLTEILVNCFLLFYLKDIINLVWLFRKILGLVGIGFLSLIFAFFCIKLITIKENIFIILYGGILYLTFFLIQLFLFYPTEMKALKLNIKK